MLILPVEKMNTLQLRTLLDALKASNRKIFFGQLAKNEMSQKYIINNHGFLIYYSNGCLDLVTKNTVFDIQKNLSTKDYIYAYSVRQFIKIFFGQLRHWPIEEK